MATPDTRTQLLDAAERLFAERGFRGTSVRAITDLAGANLIMTIITDPAEEMRAWPGPAEDVVRDRYLVAFGRALPGLSPEELWFRMRGILAVTAVDRVQVYQNPPASLSPVAGEAARRWALTYLTAAMSAPPTVA
jgi:hypothetical protein